MTDAELLANRSHPQPHSYLGAHPSGDRIVIRVFRPGAQEVTAVLDDGSRQPLEQTHPAGVFEAESEGRKLPLRYRLDVTYTESGTLPIDDPYRFLPTLGELDMHLVGEGRHEAVWARLGAHVREMDGVNGVGNGENALHVASLGLSVLGVDVAETALAIARDKADRRGIEVAFAAADAFELERLPV